MRAIDVAALLASFCEAYALSLGFCASTARAESHRRPRMASRDLIPVTGDLYKYSMAG